MQKQQRIVINIAVLLVVAAFVGFVVRSMSSWPSPSLPEDGTAQRVDNTASLYKLMETICIDGDIECFDVGQQSIYVVSEGKVLIYDLLGVAQGSFAVQGGVRDIAVHRDRIYALHPARIDVYSVTGAAVLSWEACSESSDYCSLAVGDEFVFVTDALNKHVVKYATDGTFITFINSPVGFIIPSFAFDIVVVNDTVYCANSGRHLVESYTLGGQYIGSFGGSGTGVGLFVGCCNPIFLADDTQGGVLTSEKGIPRITQFAAQGKESKALIGRTLLGRGTLAAEIKCEGGRIYSAANGKINIYEFK